MHSKIMLTVPEPLMDKLKRKMKRDGYLSVQELINAIIREAVIPEPRGKDVISVDKKDKEFIDYFSERGD